MLIDQDRDPKDLTTPEIISSMNESQFHEFSATLFSNRNEESKKSLASRWRMQASQPKKVEVADKSDKESVPDFMSCIDESIRMQDLGKGLSAIADMINQSRKLMNERDFTGGKDIMKEDSGIFVAHYEGEDA